MKYSLAYVTARLLCIQLSIERRFHAMRAMCAFQLSIGRSLHAMRAMCAFQLSIVRSLHAMRARCAFQLSIERTFHVMRALCAALITTLQPFPCFHPLTYDLQKPPELLGVEPWGSDCEDASLATLSSRSCV
jgi:hypothetical protein